MFIIQNNNIGAIEKMDETKSNAICHVCGTTGAQTHYGGICCVSCKMFFRRNAQFDLVR